MKGASARKTKRHFGHSPHQRCAGRSPEQVEVAVAAGEVRVVAIELRELPGHRQLRERPQQRVVLEIGGDVRAQVGGEVALEVPAFDHWWLTSPVPGISEP
jgi:hypothetical protein